MAQNLSVSTLSARSEKSPLVSSNVCLLCRIAQYLSMTQDASFSRQWDAFEAERAMPIIEQAPTVVLAARSLEIALATLPLPTEYMDRDDQVDWRTSVMATNHVVIQDHLKGSHVHRSLCNLSMSALSSSPRKDYPRAPACVCSIQ